jgi:GWxTD domain-containing protein
VAPALALALSVGAGGRAAAGIDPDRARPLPWRSEGRLLFIADVVPAPSPAGDPRTRLDVVLRVPGDQLRYVDRGDSLVGELRLTVEFRTRFGKPEHREVRTIPVTSPARSASGYSPGHLLLESFHVPAGPHQLRIRVEDLQQNRRGLAYVGRKSPERGTAEGLLEVPRYPGDRLTVSRPLFVWALSALDSTAGGDAFRRVPGGLPVLPDPDRTYGLYDQVARAYFEVRPPAGAPPAPSTVVARVRAADGRVLAIVDSAQVDEAGPWSGRLGFEVATLPAGSFDLEVEIRRGGEMAVGSNRFNIAWRPESWERDPREFLEEAHFLLDDPDLESRYAEMTAGEQEAYLDRYWRDRDPTPLTAQNEERDRFYDRVRYANEHFGTQGVVRGMLSDRGRIYIRYGEPDEIRQQVIPAGSGTLQDVAREIATIDDDPAFIQLKKRAIGGDERAFEVWTYNRAWGSENERLRGGSQNRLVRKFVFVDEEGYGNYTLKYSSE